ncbi:MAG: hypothetical protein ACLR8P_02125 [Clostridium fessum]
MTDDAKNFMHYSNTEYDDVFNTAYTTVDDDVKVENYKKAQMILRGCGSRLHRRSGEPRSSQQEVWRLHLLP